jgi:3-hydroxyisobutyrate dehydrogenase-like beta-hydroxyacid dehydrogenase
MAQHTTAAMGTAPWTARQGGAIGGKTRQADRRRKNTLGNVAMIGPANTGTAPRPSTEAQMVDIADSLASTRPAGSGRAGKASPNLVLAFIGLGRMGTVMAANLAAAGHDVIAYLRHPARAAELASLGIRTVTAFDEIFACDVVITMLPDDAAVRDVVFGSHELGRDGLVTGMSPGSIHLGMSTVSPLCAADVAAAHARHTQGYVAAPVFGNPDAARARELFIIAAGALDHIERCRPLLDSLGQKTFVIGSDPAAASIIKLAGNAISAVTIETLAEILALARKRGVDPALLMAVLTGTMYGGRAHRLFGGKIAGQDYMAGGFVFPLALKDVRLMLAEGEAAAVPMPTLSVVRDRLLTGIAKGYAVLDWSALGLLAAEEAGLTVASPTLLGSSPR